MTFNGVNPESCSDPQKPVLEALGQGRVGLRVTQGKMLFFHLNHFMIALLFLKFGNPIKERTGTLLQKVWHVLLLGKGSCWLCLGLAFNLWLDWGRVWWWFGELAGSEKNYAAGE